MREGRTENVTRVTPNVTIARKVCVNSERSLKEGQRRARTSDRRARKSDRRREVNAYGIRQKSQNRRFDLNAGASAFGPARLESPAWRTAPSPTLSALALVAAAHRLACDRGRASGLPRAAEARSEPDHDQPAIARTVRRPARLGAAGATSGPGRDQPEAPTGARLGAPPGSGGATSTPGQDQPAVPTGARLGAPPGSGGATSAPGRDHRRCLR